MNYRVDAVFKDRAGKELSRKTPIWTGEADDAKHAIVQAHDPVTIVCKANPTIDSISLTVKGADGSMVHTTEYAEDFTIGYGASALDSSGLAADGVSPNLTDEQRKQAMDQIKQRAVQALPGSLQEKLRRDAVRALDGEPAKTSGSGGEGVTVLADDSFRGDTRGDGSRSGEGYTLDSFPQPPVCSPGDGCDKTFSDCKNKWNNAKRFGGAQTEYLGVRGKCPFVFGDHACGVTGNVGSPPMGSVQSRNSKTVAARKPDAERGRGIFQRIIDAAKRLEEVTARKPTAVNVSQRDADDLGEALGLTPGASLHGGQVHGISINVDNRMDRLGPQLVLLDEVSGHWLRRRVEDWDGGHEYGVYANEGIIPILRPQQHIKFRME